MASKIVSLVHALQTAFGVYNLYLASISIRNLLQYEEKSEKAAEWSNTAAQQLHKTRTTQASSTGAILLSVVSSLSLTVYSTAPTIAKLGVAGANIAVLLVVRQHVGAFWKGKAKIPLPGVGDYNEAIGKTQEVRLNMAYLIASWLVTGIASLAI